MYKLLEDAIIDVADGHITIEAVIRFINVVDEENKEHAEFVKKFDALANLVRDEENDIESLRSIVLNNRR